MHRSRAHFACRVGFVLLCLLPTAAVAGWIVQRSLPGYALSAKQEWEQELSRQLGLKVTCSAVDYSRPNTAELSNVLLTDPETGAAVASVATLEAIRESDRWKLIGWQAVIESSQLPLLKEQFEQQWLRRSVSEQLACEIWFREVTLRDANRGLTLVDVSGNWQSPAEGPRCELSFRLPEADPKAPRGRLIVERNRQTTPPTTRWQLETGSLPLPCSLVSGEWLKLKHLGAGAEFSGQVEMVQSGDQAAGRLRGTLTNLDLDALVSEQFAHQLSGVAVCKIEDAVLEQNRLRLIRGTLQARDGWISRSLLTAASEHLQLACPPVESLASGTAPVSFRQLSLGFDLRDEGLQLTGSADPLRTGVLLATAAGSLLEAPPRHRASALGLLRTLVPENEWQVPAARQAQSLARFLPAPELTPTGKTARALPHVPTTLRPSQDPQAPAVRQPQLR